MNCSCMYVLSDESEEYYDALAKLFPLIYGELYADSLAILNTDVEVSTDYDGEDEIHYLEKGTRFLWASGKYGHMFGFESIAAPLFPRRMKNEKGEWEKADYNGDWYTDIKEYD